MQLTLPLSLSLVLRRLVAWRMMMVFHHLFELLLIQYLLLLLFLLFLLFLLLHLLVVVGVGYAAHGEGGAVVLSGALGGLFDGGCQ